MPLFAITWPWIGLGAAGALLLVLFATDGLQADRTRSRWFDLPWLVWLGVAAYLLHQFEEHGVDLLGEPYAFRGEMCDMLGFPDPISCPVPLSYITCVNVSAVWVVGVLSALLAPRRPLIGLSFFAVPLVNAVVHMGSAIWLNSYNPGLLTACLLFLPLSLWTISVAVSRAGVPRRAVIFLMIGGVLLHAVLLGSIKAYLNDLIGVWPLDILQVLNSFVPAAVMLAGVRQAPPPSSSRAAPPGEPKRRGKANLRAV